MSNMDYLLFTIGKKKQKQQHGIHLILFAGFEFCDIKLVSSGIRKRFEMIINIKRAIKY